jgi:hypothetical protein
MKYIKNFNESEKSIEDWCKEFNISFYNIINGIVNVHDTLYITSNTLNKIPIKFNRVNGSVYLNVKIKSLNNSPRLVDGSFYCSDVGLKTLVGGPFEVRGSFYCNNNKLESLIGSPQIVGRGLYFINNKLLSLDGLSSELIDDIYFSNNPIYTLSSLFGGYEGFLKYIDDYKFMNGNDIYEKRFKKACEDAEVEMPEYIQGYIYI